MRFSLGLGMNDIDDLVELLDETCSKYKYSRAEALDIIRTAAIMKLASIAKIEQMRKE